MADVTIHGPPQSSYVRTARMACEEKGISHDLTPVEPGSDAHRQLHPFAKFPILEHGGVTVCETSAICRYIDDVFDGPALVPADAEARATMETWISNVNCYFYPDMVRDYVLQYVFPRGADGKPDRKVIDGALPGIKRDLAVLDRALDGVDFVAGRLSLADLFIAPVMAVLSMFPEGKQAIGDFPNIQRVGGPMMNRPSFQRTQPPPPQS